MSFLCFYKSQILRCSLLSSKVLYPFMESKFKCKNNQIIKTNKKLFCYFFQCIETKKWEEKKVSLDDCLVKWTICKNAFLIIQFSFFFKIREANIFFGICTGKSFAETYVTDVFFCFFLNQKQDTNKYISARPDCIDLHQDLIKLTVVDSDQSL